MDAQAASVGCLTGAIRTDSAVASKVGRWKDYLVGESQRNVRTLVIDSSLIQFVWDNPAPRRLFVRGTQQPCVREQCE